jgi:hypothetical protein
VAESFLTRKLGPFPVWAYLGAVTAGLGAWAWIEHGKSSSSSAGGSDSDGGDQAPPDVVIQNQLPPEAPAPGSGGSTGTTDPNRGSGKTGPVRRVATGKQSLTQIAKSRHTTVAHIISVTRASKEISPANLKKFLDAARNPRQPLPKGTVYYTSN